MQQVCKKIEVHPDAEQATADPDRCAMSLKTSDSNTGIKRRTFESALSLLSSKRAKQSRALRITSKGLKDAATATTTLLSKLPNLDKFENGAQPRHSFQRISLAEPKSHCFTCFGANDIQKVQLQHVDIPDSNTDAEYTEGSMEAQTIKEGKIQQLPYSPCYQAPQQREHLDPLKCMDDARIQVLELVQERLGIEGLVMNARASGNVTRPSFEHQRHENKQLKAFKSAPGLQSPPLCSSLHMLEHHQENLHKNQCQSDTAFLAARPHPSSPVFSDPDGNGIIFYPGKTASCDESPCHFEHWEEEHADGENFLLKNPVIRHPEMQNKQRRAWKEVCEHCESSFFNGSGVIASLLANGAKSPSPQRSCARRPLPFCDEDWGQEARNKVFGHLLMESLNNEE
jgi:hypothetical protein